jgi:hypothetical protein
MNTPKTLILMSLILALSACTSGTNTVETESSSGTDNGKAYTLNMTESCQNQSLNFREIAQRDGVKETGTDIGVYFDNKKKCAGVWEFDFELGALLANIRPDIDSSSFALIRQEGDQIFISALTITTGWDIASHVGGTKTMWLGALPAVETGAGETVEITFKKPRSDKEIILHFAFSAEIGEVTITEVSLSSE